MKLKFKLFAMTASVVPVSIMMVSCSNTSVLPAAQQKFSEFFSDDRNSGKDINVVRNPFIHSFDKNYGMNRDDYFDGAGSIELNSYKDRIRNGTPLVPGMQIQDIWNWIPLSSINGQINSSNNQDFIGWNNQIYDTKVPKSQRLYWDIDSKFNRATIDTPMERVFAQPLKESQSTFAQFTPTDIIDDVGAKIGFIKNDNIMSKTHIANDMIPYSSLFAWWSPSYNLGLNDINWPSGNIIDTMHERGIPVLGNIFLAGNSFGQDGKIMVNPGPEKDYPIAKGLVELARFYGLDGWWFDFEQAYNLYDVEEFMKALASYSKTDEYINVDGKRIVLGDQNKNLREEYNYDGSKELIVGSYVDARGGLQNAEEYIKYSDYLFNWQMHGDDAYSIGRYWESAYNHNKDRYFYNGASNWPEDNFLGTMKNNGKYYSVGVQMNNSYSKMNPFSLWWYSMFHTSQNTSEEYYSSYAGDPRVSDLISKWSISNSFREQTSIIGRKPWATNFSTGKGKTLFLGSQNVSAYTIGTSNMGWKNNMLVDELPTYKWIMDYYDEKGNNVTDLNLDNQGKLVRPIVPRINDEESENAFLGGTSLNYVGKLPLGQSFVNRLYASNINVKTGDKFTIKIKDNWMNDRNSEIIPQLSIGLVDKYIAPEYYKSDGTEDDPLAADPKFKLGFSGNNPWERRSSLLRYKKDILNGLVRHNEYIKPTIVTHKNKSIDITYDLSPFNNKAIVDFGIKATSKIYDDNIQISLLQMKYIPNEYQQEQHYLKSLSIDKVFNYPSETYKKARIAWDDSVLGNSPLKNYLVYYLDENNNRTTLAWVGKTKAAFLDFIPKNAIRQKIEIVGLDKLFNIAIDNIVSLEL